MYCEDCALKCRYGDDGSEGDLLPMMPGIGPIETAEIVVIMSHPYSPAVLISSEINSILDRCLATAGINRDNIYVTTLVKHPLIPGKKTIPVKALRACQKYLDAELEAAVACKIIVPMGTAPILAMTGIKGVEAQRGRLLAVEDGIPILPTYDPKSFTYNQDNEYVFISDLRKALDFSTGNVLPETTEVHDIVTVDEWDAFIQICDDNDGVVAWDIETSGLHPTTAKITDFAFTPFAGVAYIVQLHEYDEASDSMVKVISDELDAHIRKWFHSTNMQLITHGGLFDFKFTLHYGYTTYEDVVRIWFYDTIYGRHTMINEKGPFRLEYCAGTDTNLAAWDVDKLEYEAEYGKGAVWRMPHAKRRTYAGGDTDATYRLAEVYLEQGLREWPEGFTLYNERTKPMLPVIAEMLTRGMNVDPAKIKELREIYLVKYDEAKEALHKILGENVLLTSDQQVRDVLMGKLGFSWPEITANPRSGKEQNTFFWTDGGENHLNRKESLREEVRNILSRKMPHPFWDWYKQFKAHQKLLSTYIGFDEETSTVKALPKDICEVTGRIYTNLLPHGTVTSRRASSGPNLQNIPKHGSGTLVRTIFIPTEGNVFGACDLVTAEIFVAAHIAKDPVMIAALTNPGFDGKADFHRTTAAFMFGKDERDVTVRERTIAKRVSFGTLYGSGAFGISHKTNTDMTKAQEFIDAFFDMYKTLQEWQRKQVALGRENGYNVSAYGRRRRARYPKERDKWWHVDNQYKNAPIQATVGDHIATAYPRVREALLPFGGFLVNEIHDELLAEFPKENAEAALAAQLKAMTFVVPGIGLPIPVSGEILTRWKEHDDD